jgi:hypothetical protein
VKSGGGSQAHISMHVGEDWYTHLCIYDDRPPILDISAGSVMAALSIADRQVGPSAVEFARELASQTARFAAEVERHRARQLDGDAKATGSSTAGAGEAA